MQLPLDARHLREVVGTDPHDDPTPASQVAFPGLVAVLPSDMGRVAVVLDEYPQERPCEVDAVQRLAGDVGHPPVHFGDGEAQIDYLPEEPALRWRPGPTRRELQHSRAYTRAAVVRPLRDPPRDRDRHSARWTAGTWASTSSARASASEGAIPHRRSVTTRSSSRTGNPFMSRRSDSSPTALWTCSPGRGRRRVSYGTATWTGVAATLRHPWRYAAVVPTTTARGPPANHPAVAIVSGSVARSASTSTPRQGELTSPRAIAVRTRCSPNAATAATRREAALRPQLDNNMRRRCHRRAPPRTRMCYLWTTRV